MFNRIVLKRFVRIATLVALGGAVVYYRHELWRSLVDITNLGAIVLLALPLFLLWNWVASFAWLELHTRLTTGAAPSVWRLSLIRMQAQAVNLIVPMASVGGEILRSAILSKQTGQTAGTTSAVILDKIADSAAGVLFALLGVLLALSQGIDSSPTTTIVLASMSALSVLLVPFALRMLGSHLGQRESRLALSLAPILDTPGLISVGFYRALAWHMAERILMAGEIYLAMLAAGIFAGPIDVLFITAILTAYSLVFFFVPGQVGAIEAGIISAFASLGLPTSTGLTIALVRRARQLFVIAAAMLLWGIRSRREKLLAPVEPEDPP